MDVLIEEMKVEDLSKLSERALIKYLKQKANKYEAGSQNQSMLSRLKYMDEYSIYNFYNKEELIEMILQKDTPDIPDKKLEDEVLSNSETVFNKILENQAPYNLEEKSGGKLEEEQILFDLKGNNCSICNEKKQSDAFEKNMEICVECFHSSSKVQLANYLLQAFHKIEEKDQRLFFLNLKKESIEEIDARFTKHELKDMIVELHLGNDFIEDEEREITIDYHNILEIYSEKNIGDYLKTREFVEEQNEIWRQHIPKYLKQRYKDWSTASIEEIYAETNRIISEYGKTAREKLMGFSSELSEIIFENHAEDTNDEDELSDLSSEAEAYIMYMVEMIILPHLEVLDRIKEAEGNIHFVNIHNQHFSESLKKETKDRDGWKCLICKSDIDLHVHHRIPRKYGGINHIDNLVTLCSSCHGAVETANVKVAFKMGISNYRKTLGRGLKQESIPYDKEKLKGEIEDTLDKILAKALGKGDKHLSEQIVDVMDKIKIVFYD